MADKIKTFQVEGMSCEHCVSAINKAANAIDGVSAVNVDLASKSVTVEFDPDKVSDLEIKNAIENQGYDVV